MIKLVNLCLVSLKSLFSAQNPLMKPYLHFEVGYCTIKFNVPKLDIFLQYIRSPCTYYVTLRGGYTKNTHVQAIFGHFRAILSILIFFEGKNSKCDVVCARPLDALIDDHLDQNQF